MDRKTWADRDITEVLHFTTHRGLVGTLSKQKVLSRRQLPADAGLKHILHNNSKVRPEESVFFDRSKDWLDYVNLSISEINTRFFKFSAGWDHNQDRWWAIMAFDPAIMEHEGVVFATTNNGYEHCVRGVGEEGFVALFTMGRVRRKGAWSAYRGSRADRLPTCEQAEVLYPTQLSLEFLRAIYVRTDEDADRVGGWLRDFGPQGVEVRVDPSKFNGAPN